MRKAYSKKGDSGFTLDCSGRRLAKDHPRIILGGKIDALQSALDLALLGARGPAQAVLREARSRLWGEVDPRDLKRLEGFIDSLGEPPRHFVRFGSVQAVRYNECRVRCRDLESACTPLLRAGRMRP
ncbi:MAG: hypothetical protein PHU21_14985, partial [Elusimicrobia bacterium]|nr:hypothetical protein [Elusimicrobiota bacterium]